MARRGELSQFHPATRIAFWILLALLLPVLDWKFLLALSALLLLAAGVYFPQRLIGVLRRNRVLLLSVLILYCLITPGQPLGEWWPVRLITLEGALHGAMQALRLLAMLASLAWLLGGLGRERLLQGLLHLRQPLARCSLDVQRLAVRLTLTLEYIDRHLGSAAPRWQDELDSALQLRENEPHAAIRWQPESLVLQEWLILLAMTGLLVYCRLGV